MTTVAILADPPRENVVLPELSASLLSSEEATALYRAMLADVTAAVTASGGEPIVNYRDDEQLPESDESSESQLRALVTESLDVHDSVRYEVQVGTERFARVGNTITHLLEQEGTRTAAVVEPTAAFLTRSVVDSAAMKLRSSDVVLGPTTDGRVYFAAFGEPIDFTDAFETPAVETLTQRTRNEGLTVDFLPLLPVVERPEDLLTAVPTLRARRNAERLLPQRTATVVEELGLRVVDGDEGPETVRK